MKNILLVSHYSGTPGGPVDKFYEYLKKKNNTHFIKHPLWPDTNLLSIISDGKKEMSFKIYPKIQYLLESIFVLYYWCKYFKKNGRIDLAICFDSLSFIHTFFLKHFLHIKKIAFYNLDYSKKRFSNPVMNYIYNKINTFSFKKCDFFFYLSANFIDSIDPSRKFSYKTYPIKTTVSLKSINTKVKKYANSLVYAGVLDYESVNFDPLLKALKKLKKDNVDFRFDIYGKEGHKNILRAKITQLGLEKYIILKGVADNSILTKNIFPHYLIGVSPYITKGDYTASDHMFNITELTAKLVEYIAAGLPIITTPMTDAFHSIEQNKFGFLVSTTEDWYIAIKKLFMNQALHAMYRNNALKFAKNYDEKKILDPIFKKILKLH